MNTSTFFGFVATFVALAMAIMVGEATPMADPQNAPIPQTQSVSKITYFVSGVITLCTNFSIHSNALNALLALGNSILISVKFRCRRSIL